MVGEASSSSRSALVERIIEALTRPPFDEERPRGRPRGDTRNPHLAELAEALTGRAQREVDDKALL